MNNQTVLRRTKKIHSNDKHNKSLLRTHYEFIGIFYSGKLVEVITINVRETIITVINKDKDSIIKNNLQ